MNERIRELLEQAGVKYVTMPKDTVYEKFAELIVRQCIEQIQLSTARDPQNTAQYRQSVGHIHRIRKHFGVE